MVLLLIAYEASFSDCSTSWKNWGRVGGRSTVAVLMDVDVFLSRQLRGDSGPCGTWSS